jgi:50S ribosomal protein L16 3-hydroxylase
VFLIQGMGERRWKYDTRLTKDTELKSGLELRILRRFTPDADEVLRPGDLLYLPPGFAHHGVAVTPCLTYSVGFRAPAFAEMWKAFAAHAASRSGALGARLLEDPPLAPAANPGAIPPALLARVREAVRSMDTSDGAIDRFFASFATRLSLGHELTTPRKPLAESELMARLARGDVLARSEEGRWAYLPRPRGALLLYVAGEELEVDAKAAELARTLCAARRFDGKELAALAKNASARALISSLVARGGLAFAGRASARASGRGGYRASGR